MTDNNHTSKEEVRTIVHEEIAPVKKDVTSLRKWAMSALLIVVTGLFGYGVWVGTIQSRLNGVENNLDKFEQRIESRLIRIEDKLDDLITQ